MAAIANNPKFAKKVGVSKSVGEDYMKADKGRKFKQGGLKETDAESNPGLAKLPTEVRNKMGYMKKGGMASKKMPMKKFAEGGEMDENPYASSRSKRDRAIESMFREDSKPKLPGEDIERTDVNPVTKKLKDVGKTVLTSALLGPAGGLAGAAMRAKERGMKKGGMMKHEDIAKDKPMMEKVAKKAVKGHEKKMHGMKAGGTFRASANGIAQKGLTKGKMIGMKKGGAC